jgi:hypothetical protein
VSKAVLQVSVPGDLKEIVMFASNGEVMVVRFDTGGYWASVTERR